MKSKLKLYGGMMMNDQLRKSCRLFQGIDTSIFTQLLNDAQAFEKTYKEGSYLYTYGDELNHIGIVLDGVVQIIKRDYLGNITILGHFSTYDLFGESFAFSSQKLQVDIYAEQDCHILWLPIKQLLALPQKSDEYQIILKNLMMILSNKYLYLTRRIDVISQRSTKEKLLTYLYQQKQLQQQNIITIPLNRQQLADYLCVDRSALSYVLSQMKKEGILDYQKNQFHLLQY